jgi:hypothetical protein
MDKQIQQAVDKLLLEKGGYSPLELLLEEGRLLYEDYEQWRQGGEGDLEEALFGDPEQIRERLQQAADYAIALGLVSEHQDYLPWGGSGGELRFSIETGINRLFHTHYHKPADAPQLDLFMDATGASLVNGIVTALIGRDGAEANRLLSQLFDSDPGNGRLGGLERLVVAQGELVEPVRDAMAEMEVLEREITPLAEELLGRGSRDYLMPHWQRLGQALDGHPFDPGSPRLHASYPALRGEAWGRLKALVEAESGWREQPLLLCRHAQACGRLRLEVEEGCDWFRICCCFPDQADAIGREASRIWRARWLDFLELEPELPEGDFPAWSLLHEPGLVKGLEAVDCLEGAEIPEDHHLTAELVAAAISRLSVTDLIEPRKRLQALNPSLFQHYLQRFGKG